MITPGLLRRSFGQALQWRFLALWLLLVALPAAAALAPLSRLLRDRLDHSPRAQQLVAALDSHAVADLVKHLSDSGAGAALETGAWMAGLLAVLCMPLGAGAALTLARADEPVRFRALLAGAGEHYGRMLRMLVVALLPVGIAAACAAGLSRVALKSGERAILESQAMRHVGLAALGGFLLLFLARLTLDAGRAHFAAEPHRRSAFLAWWSGVRLFARRPWRVLLLGSVTLAAGAALAALFLLLRLRVHQTGPVALLLAFLLAELAAASVGWDRAARLIGLVELIRADSAERDHRGQSRPRPDLSDPEGSGT